MKSSFTFKPLFKGYGNRLESILKAFFFTVLLGAFTTINNSIIAQTNPTFTKATIDGSFNDVWEVFPADLDGDGDQDIIAVARSGAGASVSQTVWYENSGGASPVFTKISIDDTTSAQRTVFVVDIDDDNDLDIIVGTQIDGFSDGSNLFWYENDGASDPSFTRNIMGLVKGYASGIDVADLDNDGDLDVAVSDISGRSSGFSAEDVTWFENNGASDPSFTKNHVDLNFSNAEAIKIGDIDGDDDLDIVVGSYSEDDIVWYENDGATNPSFTKVFADQNALGVSQIELGDIDNDGDLDIVWADNFSDYVAWLENDGATNPSFSEVRMGTSYNGASIIEIGDLDSDGDLDVISGSGLEDEIIWYENNGASDPLFTRHEIDSLLDQPEFFRVADIDGDESPDLVGAVFRDDDVVWYNNSIVTVKPGSVSLDGVDDYVSIPHNSSYDDLSQITVEAWVYFDSDGRRGILEKHESPSSGWWVDFNTDLSAIFIGSGGNRSASSLTNPKLNTWHHVAVSFDGTDIIIYLDGINVTGTVSGTGSGAIINNTRDIRIGDLNWSSANLDGNIDEVRIWNDVRTQDEIRSNMFQVLTGNESGLIGYWAFDETNTVIANDKSSNTNTATLKNGVTRSSNDRLYGTFISGSEGWRMMTAPVGGASYGQLLDTLWTQGFTGADTEAGTSNVYTWSESAQSFSPISNASDIPAEGTGFIVYVYEDDDSTTAGIQGGFPKMIRTDSTQRSGSIAPTLSFTDTGTPADDGWNLVGNPYGASIDWDASSGLSFSNLDASFYVWSDSANGGTGSYLSWNGSTGTFGGGEIAPWQGFWVKANASSPSLSFTDEVRSGGGIFRKQLPVSELRFTLSGSDLSSTSILMFSEQASESKDVLDAYKLQSLNQEYLSLFTRLKDGTGLDINSLPLDLEGEVSIPLGFDGSDLNGVFQLSWNPNALPAKLTITLLDSETGEEWDLSTSGSLSLDLGEKAKTVETHDITPPQGLTSPIHQVFSPQVLKTKAAGTRFTIQLSSGTSVSNELKSELPQIVELSQNYPNPFNPSTTINFAVPEQSQVQLVVYDMLGRQVAQLLDEPKSAGRYSLNFDASNLASGLYLYRLQVGSSVLTKKMTLIK